MAKFYAILLSILIPFSAAGQQPRSAKDFSERGIKRYTTGDYEGAAADFTVEIRLTSSAAVSKKEIIQGYAGSDLQPFSISHDVTVIDPRTAGALVNRGNAFFAMNRVAEAIEDYSRAIAIRPAMKEAYVCRGTALMIAKDFHAAEADYSKALKLDPTYVKALVGRAMVRFDNGNRTLAFEDFDRAISIAPESDEAWHTRGEAKRMSGDSNGALADFERALILKPNNPMALLGRGIIRLNRREFAGAIEDLTMTIKLDPRLPQGYRNLGYALYAVGRFDEAERHFAKSIDLAPEFRDEIGRNKASIDRLLHRKRE